MAELKSAGHVRYTLSSGEDRREAYHRARNALLALLPGHHVAGAFKVAGPPGWNEYVMRAFPGTKPRDCKCPAHCLHHHCPPQEYGLTEYYEDS